MSKLGAVAVGAVVILGIVGFNAWNTFTPANPDHACAVTDKDHSYSHSKNSTKSVYRVYTKDCGVFEVQDSFFHGKFRSADTYSSIEVGHSYDFTAYGHRVGLLSMFPNIVKAVEVGKKSALPADPEPPA